MAAKSAIGIRRLMAVEKLIQAMSDLFGEGFILPTQGRDPDLLHAVQLEAIADFLAAQVKRDPSPDVDPLVEDSAELNALIAMREMKPVENKGTRKRKAS